MRRADRLFRLVELLRSRRFATGAWLADQLEVSLRTLYRDIRDLCASGMPIEGEAGVGYRLRYRLDVPPLLFDTQELEALLIGSRMVQAWGDTELAAAAGAALAKIHNALPGGAHCPPVRAAQTGAAGLVAGVALGDSSPQRGVDGLSARGWYAVAARGLAARPVFLGKRLDADRLVYHAQRFPPLPRRSHSTVAALDYPLPCGIGTAS